MTSVNCAKCTSYMEVQFISLDLTVLRLITHVLEPHLNMRQAAFVSLGVTADALPH